MSTLHLRLWKLKINPKNEIFRYSKSFAEPSLVYYLGGPWTLESTRIYHYLFFKLKDLIIESLQKMAFY